MHITNMCRSKKGRVRGEESFLIHGKLGVLTGMGVDSACASVAFGGEFWAGEHAKLKLNELSKWCQIKQGS